MNPAPFIFTMPLYLLYLRTYPVLDTLKDVRVLGI